jgi:hypothetical protein
MKALEISRRLKLIKSSQAIGCFGWLKMTDVSGISGPYDGDRDRPSNVSHF